MKRRRVERDYRAHAERLDAADDAAQAALDAAAEHALAQLKAAEQAADDQPNPTPTDR